jgi:hypothetical protein
MGAAMVERVRDFLRNWVQPVLILINALSRIAWVVFLGINGVLVLSVLIVLEALDSGWRNFWGGLSLGTQACAYFASVLALSAITASGYGWWRQRRLQRSEAAATARLLHKMVTESLADSRQQRLATAGVRAEARLREQGRVEALRRAVIVAFRAVEDANQTPAGPTTAREKLAALDTEREVLGAKKLGDLYARIEQLAGDLRTSLEEQYLGPQKHAPFEALRERKDGIVRDLSEWYDRL